MADTTMRKKNGDPYLTRTDDLRDTKKLTMQSQGFWNPTRYQLRQGVELFSTAEDVALNVTSLLYMIRMACVPSVEMPRA